MTLRRPRPALRGRGVWVFLAATAANAFQAPSPPRKHESPNLASDGDIVLASDGDRLLTAAFSSLSEADKYETVLSGLCSKVIDAGPGSAGEGLVDPFRLMEEMNAGGIAAGPRGIIGLVDVSVIFLCT